MNVVRLGHSLSDRQLQVLRVAFHAHAPLSDADIAQGCYFERWEKYRVTLAVSLLVDEGLLADVGSFMFEITEEGRAVVLDDRIMR